MSPPDKAAPQHFDRYTLVARWLDSYFGMLWQARVARGEGQGDEVALRLVDTANLKAEDLEGLRKAASGVVGFEHASLVPVREVVAEEGQLAIISAPVDGISLRRAFELADEPLSVPLALRIGQDMLRAVSTTHLKAQQLKDAAGFAYGGLTPDHFVIGADGRTRLLEPALGSALRQVSVWSQNAQRLGWDPVEVLQVGTEVEAAADVFSIGVMFWELLRGERFMSGSPFQVITKLRCSVYPRVDDNELAEDEIPEALGDLIDQAINREAEERFASAGEMALAVEALDLPTASHDEVGDYAKELAERAPPIEPRPAAHPAIRVTSASTPPKDETEDEPPAEQAEEAEPDDQEAAADEADETEATAEKGAEDQDGKPDDEPAEPVPPPRPASPFARKKPAAAPPLVGRPAPKEPPPRPPRAESEASIEAPAKRGRLLALVGLAIVAVVALVAFWSARWESGPDSPPSTTSTRPKPEPPPPPPTVVPSAPATEAAAGGASPAPDGGDEPAVQPSVTATVSGPLPSARPWPTGSATAPQPSGRKRPGDYVPDGL
ncbi:MAG: protein kinase [Deltaproteobacteria bacterium]|nr:protein kinase [Deltaproteobacteria bacterium]